MKEHKTVSAKALYRKYGIFVIMVVIFVLAAILNKNFLKPNNLINVLKQITPFTIVACAETMFIISGCIDLSAGAVLALSACVSANVLVSTGSVFLCFAISMLIGCVFGYFNGSLITKFDLPPFIATLASTNIAKGVTYVYTNGESITGLDKLRWLSQGKLFDVIPYMVILMAVCLIFVHIILSKTTFGLNMYAVGGNKKASIAAGINVGRQLRLTYFVGGILIGVAAVATSARMMAGQPAVGPGYEFDAITATVVGGTSFNGGIGSAFCILMGAIIIGIINNIMVLMGIDSNWQIVVKGVLIALAVVVDIQTKKDIKSA